MAKVIFGNHSSVIAPRQDRNRIRNFYCDVLGGKIMKAEDGRDFVRLGENFYIGFLYGDVRDESEFLRTARSVWPEIKSDNVEDETKNPRIPSRQETRGGPGGPKKIVCCLAVQTLHRQKVEVQPKRRKTP
jgi:hypothetical protein